MNENACSLILDLHKHDGTLPISKLPGLWKRKLDERWTFWVNGHMDGPRKVEDGDQGGQGFEVHPGDVFVEFNGWPAGSFSLITGEGIIAAGAAANYETFCDALRGALAEPKVAA